ncbi:MAG TPA: protein TolR [Hyphomicrobiales bacterium]|nr:protein TolR [Rhodobiaceae bacterium]HXK53757.1 protein TolR [Hyphomicrobiales bacterium]
MGAGTVQGNGGGRRKRKRYAPMSEINVTPLVDVMLVLLIVFMVTAPLLTVGVPIDLPETKAQQLQGEKEPLTITVDVKGKIFVQDTEIVLDEVVAKLLAISANGYEERIYVRGDRGVDYGTVMKVMGAVSAAGFRRIALVTELDESS